MQILRAIGGTIKESLIWAFIIIGLFYSVILAIIMIALENLIRKNNEKY